MYGRTDLEWGRLVDAGRAYLEEVAARKDGFTDYTELNMWMAEETGQPTFDFSRQDGRNAVARILGEISRKTYGEYGFMLSALVLYQNMGTAGIGFFNLANQLIPQRKLTTESQRDTFWLEQVNTIRAHYRPNAAN